MKCRICGERFFIRRSLLSLFNEDKEYICRDCYKKYHININYETIQLDCHKAMVISIFKKKLRLDYNLFFKEYSKIFLSLYNNGVNVFFLDDLKYSYDFYEYLDCISKIEDSDIVILCFSIRD